MQNATITPVGGRLMIDGSQNTNESIRFALFAASADATPSLIIELNAQWTIGPDPAQGQVLSGTLNIETAKGVRCVVRMFATNSELQLSQVSVRGTEMFSGIVALSKLAESTVQSVQSNEPTTTAQRLTRLFVNNIERNRDPLSPVGGRLDVMFARMPSAEPRGAGAGHTPLFLLCARTVRWNINIGAPSTDRVQYVLREAGVTDRPIVLSDFAWRTNNKPPYAFTLAQFTESNSDGSYTRVLAFAGLPGRGIRDYWNLVIAAQQFKNMKQRFTTVPTFEVATQSVVDSAQANFGNWALLFRSTDSMPAWKPSSLQAMSALPMVIKLNGFRMHDSTGLTLWTRMQPLVPSSPFPPVTDINTATPDGRAPEIATVAMWLPGLAQQRDHFYIASEGIGTPLAGGSIHDQRLRVGALDLQLDAVSGSASFPTTILRASSRDGTFLQEDIVKLEHDVHVGVRAVQPGGQDDIPLYQQDPAEKPDPTDKRFIAEAAMVVPVRHGGNTQGLWLELIEGNRSVDDAWPLAMRVHATGAAAGVASGAYCATDGPRKDQVVVIEAAPMLVALVEYPFFLTNTLTGTADVVAKWSRDTQVWETQSDNTTNETCVVLPPQATGEDMEKEGTLANSTSSPIGYRLGRPARMLLTLGNGATTNFTEAPWNVHRLFRDTNISLGSEPRLKSLQFELLYGLPCKTDPTATAIHRIADIGRRLGTVPRNLRAHLSWEPNAIALHKNAYEKAREAWAKMFERYQSRLLILEPFPELARYSLDPAVLEHPLLSCELSDPPSVDAASPFDTNPGRRLRGGTLWGIESPNLYSALLDNDNKKSYRALLSGGGFTALGGYGHTETSFLGGLSKIIARVEMGRVAEYTVERKGRIGVFWNKCKHVIVYRRTVLPSEQFEPFQPKLAGRAIVRKFAEYIEIEEDTRRFLTDDNAAQIGFVSSCVFPKGTRINVRSAWGGDVGRIGYRIPLWNPTAAAAQPNVYPKPVVALTAIRSGRQHPVGGGPAPSGETESAEATCTIDEPQNLQFFSYTATTEANTDSWAAVEGVDYIDLPAPVPSPIAAVVSATAQVTSMTPPDTKVPAGFERVTFKVQPNDVGVNLVAGRQSGASIGGRIDTLTMVRGPFAPPAAAGDADAAARALLSNVASQVDDAHRAIAEIAANLASTADAGTQVLAYLNGGSLPPGPAGIAIDAARTRYAAAVAAVATTAGTVIDRRKQRLTEITEPKLNTLHASLASGATARLKDAIKQFKEEADAVQRHIQELHDTTKTVEFLKAFAIEQLDRLRHLGAIAEPVIQDSARLVDAAVAFQNSWKESVKVALTLLSDVKNRPLLEQWIAAWEARIDDTIRQLASGRPEWLTATPAIVAGALAPYTAALQNVRTMLTAWDGNGIAARLGAVEAEATTQLKLVIATACPTPDESITDPGLRILACSALGAKIITLRDALVAVTGNTNIDALPQAIHDRLVAELDALVSDSGITNLIADTQTRAREVYSNLVQQAKAGEQQIVDQISNQKKAIEDELNRQAKASTAELRAAVDDLRNRATRVAEGVVGSVARDLRPIVGLGDIGTVADAAGKSLKLVRAFGDPPDVSQLGFTREKLGYFYPQVAGALDRVGITPVVARVMQVGNALKAAGLDLPVQGLAERLLPATLGQFKLNDIFSDFGGLKLKALFSAIPFPSGVEKNIKVTHHIKDGRACLEARVDNVVVSGAASVFNIGPLELLLDTARFDAKIIVASTLAGPDTPDISGTLTGTWQLKVGGTKMISFVDTELRFASPGSLQFKVDPKKVQLADALQFVTALLDKLNPGNLGGLHVSLTPTGIESLLETSLAPIQVGTTAISNLRIGARFAVAFAPSFAIEVGGFLAKRDAPFALTIFVLGGGGFLDVRSRYEVSTGRLSCTASLGISAAASVGIALGPIRGGVFVSLGFAVDFESSGENRGLRISVIFVIRGEVSVLGLIDVCLSLYLELSYEGSTGTLRGTGIVSLRIKICWCFTLKVKAQVTYTLGCDPAIPGHHALAAPRIAAVDIDRIARDYVALLA